MMSSKVRRVFRFRYIVDGHLGQVRGVIDASCTYINIFYKMAQFLLA